MAGFRKRGLEVIHAQGRVGREWRRQEGPVAGRLLDVPARASGPFGIRRSAR
jgi:hypothetical protein